MQMPYADLSDFFLCLAQAYVSQVIIYFDDPFDRATTRYRPRIGKSVQDETKRDDGRQKGSSLVRRDDGDLGSLRAVGYSE